MLKEAKAMCASNCTDRARERWLFRKKHPQYQPPKFEPKHDKAPGSKELVLGEWREVDEKAPASPSGGG